MANNGVANEQESVKIAVTSTKVSLRCDLCTFKTHWLRRSKDWQLWYNHRYSHIVNINRFQYSACDYNDMEEEGQEDIFEEVSEQADNEPNWFIITRR